MGSIHISRHWQPTATSSRRSPVNPMMPMPDSLYERVSGARRRYGRSDGKSRSCGRRPHPPDNALIFTSTLQYIGTIFGYGDDLDVKTLSASVA